MLPIKKGTVLFKGYMFFSLKKFILAGITGLIICALIFFFIKGEKIDELKFWPENITLIKTNSDQTTFNLEPFSGINKFSAKMIGDSILISQHENYIKFYSKIKGKRADGKEITSYGCCPYLPLFGFAEIKDVQITSKNTIKIIYSLKYQLLILVFIIWFMLFSFFYPMTMMKRFN